MSALKTVYLMLKTAASHPATKGNEAAAFWRILHWQIRSRLDRGPHVVPFVGPTQLLAIQGDTAVTGNLYFGLAEFPEMAFALHYLRPGDLFVDVGANIGVFSLLASGVNGARSIAFEPYPSTVSRLRSQIEFNGLGHLVEVRPMALGAVEGIVAFRGDLGTANRVATSGETGTIEIPQSTLDLQLVGLTPGLIKMDVEGYEYSVLQGGAAVLQNQSVRAIILESHDGIQTFQVDPDALTGLLADAGFSPFFYDATKRELRPVSFKDAHAHGLSDNVLMVRDLDFVEDRLKTGPSFSVCGRSF